MDHNLKVCCAWKRNLQIKCEITPKWVLAKAKLTWEPVSKNVEIWTGWDLFLLTSPQTGLFALNASLCTASKTKLQLSDTRCGHIMSGWSDPSSCFWRSSPPWSHLVFSYFPQWDLRRCRSVPPRCLTRWSSIKHILTLQVPVDLVIHCAFVGGHFDHAHHSLLTDQDIWFTGRGNGVTSFGLLQGKVRPSLALISNV